MTDLGLLATTLGVSDRTLRRAASRGTIRCVRHGERRLELPIQEALYLQRRWPTIHSLVTELRTLPDIRLAVLFGSIARGDEDERSDIDILVRFANPGLRPRARLLKRLGQALSREVQIVGMDDANPLLLADVLRDGRVLVDRDEEWASLTANAPEVFAEAEKAREQLDRDVFEGLGELLSEATV
jgi:predicted nucleotidyltransferase